jgi:hypothetical protein
MAAGHPAPGQDIRPLGIAAAAIAQQQRGYWARTSGLAPDIRPNNSRTSRPYLDIRPSCPKGPPCRLDARPDIRPEGPDIRHPNEPPDIRPLPACLRPSGHVTPLYLVDYYKYPYLLLARVSKVY